MEFGRAEKHRVEEIQRTARKIREKSEIHWVPRYFELQEDQDTGEELWTFNHKYWENRRQQDWSTAPDIFEG